MRVFFSLLAVILIHSATASATGTCVDTYCTAQISRMYMNASGHLYIGTSGDETKLNCKATSGVYLSLSKDNPGFDAIYASLLAYQLAGDPVWISIVPGSDGCQIVYAVFDK